jgi:hypothetical protein
LLFSQISFLSTYFADSIKLFKHILKGFFIFCEKWAENLQNEVKIAKNWILENAKIVWNAFFWQSLIRIQLNVSISWHTPCFLNESNKKSIPYRVKRHFDRIRTPHHTTVRLFHHAIFLIWANEFKRSYIITVKCHFFWALPGMYCRLYTWPFI